MQFLWLKNVYHMNFLFPDRLIKEGKWVGLETIAKENTQHGKYLKQPP